jgi:phosphate transport system permease protein
MVLTVFIALLAVSVLAYGLGYRRATGFSANAGQRLHSRPSYHGAYIAAWVGIPAFFMILIWLLLQNTVLDALIMTTLPDEVVAGLDDGQRGLLLAEIKSVARGLIFQDPVLAIREAAATYARWLDIARWGMLGAALLFAIVGFSIARSRIAPRFKARDKVEQVLDGMMVLCATLAILTTVGIVVSLAYESVFFFKSVPVQEFLFGLNWEPQIAIRADQVVGKGAFGAIPVFAGTFLISAIAMIVAGPVGLLSATYLTEYASPGFRAIAKPALEILAGVPTIVYGFFAVLVISPAIRDLGASLELDIVPNSALAAGAVMGIMIIPFISSLSDDALKAVPLSLREGSLALGATQAETITKVLLPAALPGIMGGVLLAVSRVIGETMIVVMAAGLIANLTINPFQSVTTVTVQIVTLLIGDTAFDNPKTLAAFALGLMLFLITLALNVIAHRVAHKYREQYD